MIKPDLIKLFDSTIENWNYKQKLIAQNLIIDQTYEIIQIYDNNKPKLLIKNNNENIVMDFEEYVKSKCNC